jgi:ComF family protein
LTALPVSALKAGLQGLGALFFPSICLLCRGSLRLPLEGPLCGSCLERFPRIEEPFCPRCGLPYGEGVAPGLCGTCRERPRYFRRARAAAPYLDDVRLSLHALKYGGRRRVAEILGRRAGRTWVASGELSGASAVIPVPLSPRRKRERGYNQAELIAKAVAREARLPLRRRVLKKTKECPPQAGLSASSRRTNVRSAYRARLPRSLRGKTLLLVDDVLTTGATAEAAALALLAAGAGAVDVLTLARVP